MAVSRARSSYIIDLASMDSLRTVETLAAPGSHGTPGKKRVGVALSAFSMRRSFVIRYGAALLLSGTALLASLAMQHLFAFPYPFLFLFFGAVMVSAWMGGMGAGLFAVLLSTLLVDYFFVPPFYSCLWCPQTPGFSDVVDVGSQPLPRYRALPVNAVPARLRLAPWKRRV